VRGLIEVLGGLILLLVLGYILLVSGHTAAAIALFVGLVLAIGPAYMAARRRKR
jgi:uncharacterized membrane protein